MSNDFEWNIDMPDGCPPDTAFACNGDVFYRVVECEHSENDFVCNRKRRTEKDYRNNICTASGMSIESEENAIRKTLNLPAIREEYNNPCVAKIELFEDDGKVEQSGNRETHYTFWRSSSFNYTDTIEIIT